MAEMDDYRRAIQSIESSGNYQALGPVHPRYGQALGAYQVMESNLPSWSQAALGRTVSRDEFLADPKIQDAIFDHKFGGYVAEHGPENAASMWLTGKPMAQAGNVADANGTTSNIYVNKFRAALGAPQDAASGSSRPSGSLFASAAPAASAGSESAEPTHATAKPEDDPLAAMKGLLSPGQKPAAKAVDKDPGGLQGLLAANEQEDPFGGFLKPKRLPQVQSRGLLGMMRRA